MDVYGVALSGMQAAQKLMQTAANNIANANSPGYQTQQTSLTNAPGGGVQASTTTTGNGAPDIATQMVDLQKAVFLYKANAAVIRAAASITGSLLDILDNDNDRHRHDNE